MDPKRRAGPSKKKMPAPPIRAGTLSAIPEHEVIADVSISSCSDDSSATIKPTTGKKKEDEGPNYDPVARDVGDYCIIRYFPGVHSPKSGSSKSAALPAPVEPEAKKTTAKDNVVENLNKFMEEQEKKRASDGSAKKKDGNADGSAKKASSPNQTRKDRDGKSGNEKVTSPQGKGEKHPQKSFSPRVNPKSGDGKVGQEHVSLQHDNSTLGASPKRNPNKTSVGSFVSGNSAFALTRENSRGSIYNASFETDADGDKWLPLSHGTGAIRISTGPKQTLIPLAVNRKSTDSDGKTSTPARQDSVGDESIKKTASSSGSSVRPNVETRRTSPPSAEQRPKLGKKPSLFSMRKSQSDVSQVGEKNAQGGLRTYFASSSKLNVSACDNYNWGGGYEEPKPEPDLPFKIQEVTYIPRADAADQALFEVTRGIKWTPELGVPWDRKYGVPHPDVAAAGSGWYKDNTFVASKKFVRKVAIKTADKIDEGIEDLSGDIQALLFKQEERPKMEITVIHHFEMEGPKVENTQAAAARGESKTAEDARVNEEPKAADVVATDTAEVEQLISQLEAVPVPI